MKKETDIYIVLPQGVDINSFVIDDVGQFIIKVELRAVIDFLEEKGVAYFPTDRNVSFDLETRDEEKSEALMRRLRNRGGYITIIIGESTYEMEMTIQDN